MDSIDISQIQINDWKKFLNNNKEIEIYVEKCSEYIANMYTNCKNMVDMGCNSEEALSGLKSVTCTNKSLLTSENVKNADTSCKRITEQMSEKGLKILSGLSYAEMVIDAYNNGQEVDSETKKMFSDIFKGHITDSLWILKQFAYDKFPGTSFLFGVTFSTYAADGTLAGGDCLVGDQVAEALFKKWEKGLTKLVPSIAKETSIARVWFNVSVGTCAVALFEITKGLLALKADEGKLTGKDWERLFLNAGAETLTYATWVLLAGVVGGVPGVVVANVAAFITGGILTGAVDQITGDAIIYEYQVTDKNGEKHTIKVPRNGSGKDGTYDVITQRMTKMAESSKGGENYDGIYQDWYSYGNYFNGEKMNLTEREINVFNTALDKVKTAKTEDEAAQIWFKATHYEMSVDSSYSSDEQHDSIEHVLTYLNTIDEHDLHGSFTFDIREWWKENK